MALTVTNLLVFKKSNNDDDVFTVDGVAGVEGESSVQAPVEAPLSALNPDPFE